MRERLVRVFGYASLALLVVAGQAAAQVVLNPVTSPAAAPPVIQNISIAGTGYSTTTIKAADVNVTITPPPGNGSPVTVTALSITGAGSARTVVFRVPASLTTTVPIVNCAVTVAGQTSTGIAFSSTNSSRLTVNPPARISNISQSAGAQGTSVSVTIAGLYSNFTPNISAVGAGGGVTASSVVVSSKTLLTATFAIASAAATGLRDVTVTTGGEVAALTGGFLVGAGPALTLPSVTPSGGAQGQVLDIAVAGQNTNFAQGATIANFGDGIRVNSVTVLDPTHASVNITIDSLTYTGSRTVTVVTGGEFAVAPGGFTVSTGPATLTSVSPNSAAQASTLNVTLAASNSHFLQDATVASFGQGSSPEP
ncbi:MAG: hypothetical protein LAQ69_49755 [Acidobacteriia bacterium]|nr:hypothetical protein [Terriglobia bacterium]